MSWDAFAESMLLLILASFVVERSLAVIFETRWYIQKLGDRRHLKAGIAILYAMVFVAVVDIDLAEVIRQGADDAARNVGYRWAMDWQLIASNVLVITLTGIFIAGGSKASLKLFRDVLAVRSSDEAARVTPPKAAPAKPVRAARAAVTGNTEAENMLYNLFDASIGKNN